LNNSGKFQLISRPLYIFQYAVLMTIYAASFTVLHGFYRSSTVSRSSLVFPLFIDFSVHQLAWPYHILCAE